MAQYIELLGAPGVGKTTVLAALARLGRGAAWVAAVSALRARPRWDHGPRRGIETTLLWASGRPDRRARSDASEAFVAIRPELAEVVWSNVGLRYGGDRAGARLQRVATWFDRAGAVALAASHPTLRRILFDEALLHPDYFPPDATEAEIDRVLLLLDPLPEAAILLDAPAEIVLARQRGRGVRRVTFAALGVEEARTELEDLSQVCRRVAARLGERGVPVLRVDARDPIGAIRDGVAAFLDQPCSGP